MLKITLMRKIRKRRHLRRDKNYRMAATIDVAAVRVLFLFLQHELAAKPKNFAEVPCLNKPLIIIFY